MCHYKKPLVPRVVQKHHVLSHRASLQLHIRIIVLLEDHQCDTGDNEHPGNGPQQ